MKLIIMSAGSALALCLLMAPALAQTPQGTTSAEETTARLNRERTEFAQRQMADNAASQAAHDEAVRKQADFEAETVRLTRQHEQAMARWRADVEACKNGNRKRCAPPPAN